MMQSAESWLEDQLDFLNVKVRSIESATIWNKNKWQGILTAAEDSQSDIIVKSVDTSSESGTVFRTPEDWNLIRHSDIPVMLLRDSAWVRSPTILAAIDVLNENQNDLSKRILAEADHLTRILDGELTVVVAYPLLEAWAEPDALMVDLEKLQAEINQVIRTNMDKLVEGLELDYKFLYVTEGGVAERIKSVAEESDAELLVMGTAGREGVKSFTVGNTSEIVLSHTRCDVVVLKQ